MTDADHMPRWLLMILLVPTALVVWLGPTSSSGESEASSAERPTSSGQPVLELVDASNVTELPATITGTLRNYHPGATVTLHLDAPEGPELTGEVTPRPLGSDGSATVRVTIPTGTANGEHDVFAVGTTNAP
jgi:hypothetical protein